MSKSNLGLPIMLLCLAGGLAVAQERSEHFDADPRWDGYNHRAAEPEPREVRQDFGYSRTAHAGGKQGEVGGFVMPAGEAAYYAAPIPEASFSDPLTASGTLACDGPFHLLVGFFNSKTVNEWRTPNTIAMRLNGRGEVFFAYVEYATRKWRAGGDYPRSFPTVQDSETGRAELKGFAANRAVHRWSLSYDPAANAAQGAVTAIIDGETALCELSPGHKQDGATFDRFGVITVMKSADSGGHLWMDDVTINGRTFDFSDDPNWDGVGNRRTYKSPIVRPRFDFGYSPTHFAAGQRAGELGGLVFRGDCRYPAKMAHYGDRLQALSLDKPLRAQGKVALLRGVSDSGVLIGFYNARHSMQSNPSQSSGLPKYFLGVSTDAPSRDGFYFAPTYRLNDNAYSAASQVSPPHLYPDGQSRQWTFDYSPTAADGRGQITVTLDSEKIELPLNEGDRAAGATFDRFGIISTWIDGNSQTIYFDDLTYTAGQN